MQLLDLFSDVFVFFVFIPNQKKITSRFFRVTQTWEFSEDPFQGVVGDLHLGNQRATWKKLDYLEDHPI